MMKLMIKAVDLQLSHHITSGGIKYQKLTITITSTDKVITPENITNITLPSGIDATLGVVISGRGPIWLYSYLIHELHPTPWIATHDPRLGAVVVATHCREVKIGQVIEINNNVSKHLAPALMIVGPPDSGKSILAHGLFRALVINYPDIYLQRANWDGEGNYLLDSSCSEEMAEFVKISYKGALTEEFFPYHAKSILNLRRQKQLVIVDMGGMVQPEKIPILEACSHYLIISSDPKVISSWHEFCGHRGNLLPVAVVHSVMEKELKIHQHQPFLEMTHGKWYRGKTNIPKILVTEVINKCLT